MADIVVTNANVGLVFKANARIRSYMAGATILGGQAVYIDSNGLAQLTNGGGCQHVAVYRYRSANSAKQCQRRRLWPSGRSAHRRRSRRLRYFR